MYIFDTSSFCAIFKFYPTRFPTLWNLFEELINNLTVISVAEVYEEIQTRDQSILEWVKNRKNIFHLPSPQEALFIRDHLFKTKKGHFQGIIENYKLFKGGLCADPFLIASAKIKNGIVVTEETKKPNSTKIPVICEYFNVECFNLEKFMETEGWKF